MVRPSCAVVARQVWHNDCLTSALCVSEPPRGFRGDSAGRFTAALGSNGAYESGALQCQYRPLVYPHEFVPLGGGAFVCLPRRSFLAWCCLAQYIDESAAVLFLPYRLPCPMFSTPVEPCLCRYLMSSPQVDTYHLNLTPAASPFTRLLYFQCCLL